MSRSLQMFIFLSQLRTCGVLIIGQYEELLDEAGERYYIIRLQENIVVE